MCVLEITIYIVQIRCLIIDNPGPDPGQPKSIAETKHQVGYSVRFGGVDSWVQPRVLPGSWVIFFYFFCFPLCSKVSLLRRANMETLQISRFGLLSKTGSAWFLLHRLAFASACAAKIFLLHEHGSSFLCPRKATLLCRRSRYYRSSIVWGALTT